MHSNTHTSLKTTTDVVSVPRDSHGDERVDTRGSEEGAGVLDGGLAGGGEHSEAQDG